jgi:DNA-binding response OmpR family regulator
MDIASDPSGTTVTIWLPLCEDSPTIETDDNEVWPPGQKIAGRILLVEDEPDLRRMGQNCLAGIGLEVLVAESAEFALFLLSREGPFDALVSDVLLPGMSGFELAQAVQRSHPTMPVLFMTSYSGSEDFGAMPSGANILRKPYRPDALRLRVAEMLSGLTHGSKR